MIRRPATSAAELLVLHADLRHVGGIESYWRKVLPHFRLRVESFPIGRRHDERQQSQLRGWLRRLRDWRRLQRRLENRDAPVILLNPSLKLDMLIREGFMQRLAKARGRRTIVFWRGWEPALARRIDRRGRRLFRWLYGGADAFIVLADEFRRDLERWGLHQRIHHDVTVVEDEALAGVDASALVVQRSRAAPRRVLFLARVMQAKGIFETLEAFVVLRERRVRLIIAGDGPDLERARLLASERALRDVEFVGCVDGVAKMTLLRDASLLCLPTRHGEGLPNSIVEAMAYALPVVTTRVGGVADFFRDGEHGFVVDGARPGSIAAAIARLLDDAELYRRVALRNHEVASERFLASQAAARLEAIYRSVRNG